MSGLRMPFPVFLLILGLIFSGCLRTFYNVENASIPKVGNRTLSLDEVKEAIMKNMGTNYVRYTMKDVKPGLIRCDINYKGRQHEAWVDIPYSEEAYSIKYVDSYNLRYTPPSAEYSETIKEPYNTWIQELDQSIQRNLATIEP